MIFFFRVYAPDICLGAFSRGNGTDGFYRRHYGVIHIVIAVLTVSAETPEVFYAVQICADLVKLIVCAEICGISLLYLYADAVEHIFFVDNADLCKLIRGEGNKIAVTHIPVFVALVAEIFQTDPYGVFKILHHIGRPVIEYLESAELDLALLNIYPAVGNDIAHGSEFCFVFYFQFVDEES